MKDQIKQIEQEALAEINSCTNSPGTIETLRIKYLGRKGLITELFKKMLELPEGEKREAGSLLNALKSTITCAVEEKARSVSESTDPGDKIDVTLPGLRQRQGRIHPVTKTIDEICAIFTSIGFRVVDGPEIETEYYNFETLNIPLDHPSRDAFDTFYLRQADSTKELKNERTKEPSSLKTEKHLLRSHTSPVQTRFMEKNKPPFSIIVPGRVYRPDATDASHSFMFHQVEGLAVGECISFSDLKGVLDIFVKEMFGDNIKTRFRPSFFPFTEPSAEVDISCILCGSAEKRPERCSLCGGKGWIEILGSGMVNPKVFEKVGYDPGEVTGLAFGMGVERIAILKYGISDIRMFFENDVRFLHQF